MITFLERERGFMFCQVNELYQNWNYRSVEGDLLKDILVKLSSVTVDFTVTELRRMQILFQGVRTLYAYYADVKLQHVIQGGAGRNSGVGGPAVLGLSASGNGSGGYFDGAATYNICTSILKKLE